MFTQRSLGVRWLVAAAAAVACSDDSTPTGGGGGTTPPPGADVVVGDNFFNPTSAQATAGETVVWQWAGSNPHNVTFSNGDPGSNTQTSGSFSRTFSATGTFDYFCTIHGAAVMSGTITVAP